MFCSQIMQFLKPKTSRQRETHTQSHKSILSGRSHIWILDYFLVDLTMPRRIEDLYHFFSFNGRSHFEILDNFQQGSLSHTTYFFIVAFFFLLSLSFHSLVFLLFSFLFSFLSPHLIRCFFFLSFFFLCHDLLSHSPLSLPLFPLLELCCDPLLSISLFFLFFFGL